MPDAEVSTWLPILPFLHQLSTGAPTPLIAALNVCGGPAMTTDGARPVVATFNTDDADLTLLQQAFEAEGFVIVAARPTQFSGEQDLLDFLATHTPDLVLYDVARPYVASADAFQRMYEAVVTAGYPFVISTTSPAALGPATTPADVVRAVRATLAAAAGGRATP